MAETLTVVTLRPLGRRRVDALEAAMNGEHARLRLLWQTPSHTMTEGDNLRTVIAGHLNRIVSDERKAELLV